MKTHRINALCATLAVVLAASACSLLSGSSPTATFKAFYEASKKKDAAAMKKTLSKGTLDMFEKFAKAQNKAAARAASGCPKCRCHPARWRNLRIASSWASATESSACATARFCADPLFAIASFLAIR